MTRHTTSPPRQRQAMFVLSLAFAIAAAVFGGGSFKHSAVAAEGDGAFIICKQYFATAPSVNNFNVPFEFDVEFDLDGGAPAPQDLTITVHEGGEDCSDPIVIPAGAVVEVTETTPDGWLDVPTYPRWLIEVGGVPGAETNGSQVATFDGANCVEQACTLVFKNKRDETGGGVVPPPGDPFRGNLTVCKDFVDNGDETEIGPTQFQFRRTDKNGTVDFPIGPFMREGEKGCSGSSIIDVFRGDTVTLEELPTVGFAMAPGYPKVELEGPNGFAARSGTSVTVDLTTCSEAGGFAATLIEGEPTFDCRVTFSNRALAQGEPIAETGSIRVQMITREVVDGEEAVTSDHAGWTFTLFSSDCEVNQTAATDASGFIQWDGLFPCPDFSVTEDVENAPVDGYSPVGATTVTNLKPGIETAETVVFVNERVVVTPPCEECSQPAPDPVVVEPEPTPTPEPVVADPVTVVPTVVTTPEPTQAVPTPTQETPTGEPATSTPEPQETVAGEVTTSPQPTPVAPSTGSGSARSDGGRLVIAFGLAALSFAFFLGGMNVRSRR